MSENHRVFITGYSALTASGANAEETWSSVLQGKQGIDEIKEWDISSWPCRLGGELKAFQPAKLLPDRKLMKVISRQDVMGINAAMQAVEHSQLLPYRDGLDLSEEFNNRTGVYVGSPGNKYFQQYDFLSLVSKTGDNMQAFAEKLFEEVHPMWLLRILPNNVLAYTGITYGFKGPNHNITNHAVGGLQAVLEAYHAIQQGLISRAVVIAYDMATEPQALFYYDKLGVISYRHLKPFDEQHDGTILAEGAAAMVLESEASAKARSASCFAEIITGSTSTEADGLFSVEEGGVHLAQSINQMLESHQLDVESFGMVVAHGNGNVKSDETEAKALTQVFGQYSVPVTAFKWSMGHTVCASGLVDGVLATKSLETGTIPGIANFEKAADSCKVLNLSREHRELDKSKPYSLLVNRGFGSINASLIIKRCDD
ncbi:beta-ketoacyl-[acyl-carrier-protein] synthase family protein [Legionella impletisoli]|uniref:3-oxoacyl-ACP synthase n=1 Tax=Legionella impletisoli TaxID=343510 RepID=A0A917JSJ4_9GAMM|nr:beta-ketoacyl synthase N-terminal-like domain-containing protein [Legionella impletisoli]GGI83344.1 3-oxoacyl-ACP synthase [Legionella impletisoli]